MILSSPALPRDCHASFLPCPHPHPCFLSHWSSFPFLGGERKCSHLAQRLVHCWLWRGCIPLGSPCTAHTAVIPSPGMQAQSMIRSQASPWHQSTALCSPTLCQSPALSPHVQGAGDLLLPTRITPVSTPWGIPRHPSHCLHLLQDTIVQGASGA